MQEDWDYETIFHANGSEISYPWSHDEKPTFQA